MTPHILVIDSNHDRLEKTRKHLEKFSYTTDGAESVELARDKFIVNTYHIAITNLSVESENDGKTFLRELRDTKKAVIPIAVSDKNDPDLIIHTLRDFGAYDFLLHPLESDSLKSTVERAMKSYALFVQPNLRAEAENSLYREILALFDWRSELHSRQFDSLTEGMIQQITTSFLHGAGIGSLLSSLTMLFRRAELDSNTDLYKVPKKLLELIKDEFEHTQTMAKALSNAQAILTIQDKIEEQRHIREFIELLMAEKENLSEMLAIKNQNLIFSELPGLPDKKIRLNPELMQKAIREILLNAMKYSSEQSNIVILFFVVENNLELRILNPATHYADGSIGISAQQQLMVFEPFIRLIKDIDDRYSLEEFGFGIGLPVVRKIVDLHRGNIFIQTIKYNMPNQVDDEICVTLRFHLLS